MGCARHAGVAGLAAIDWSAPWLAPSRAAGMRVAARIAVAGGRGSVAGALNDEVRLLPAGDAARLAAGKLRFVDHAELPPGIAYETFIAATACVPTRDNLHDLFAGLAWLRWPQLKRRLNELQAEQIAAHGIGSRRGRLRDALTLFDENAALLRLPPALRDALCARDWTALFVELRALWAEARVELFGHALIEKLCAPRKPITAHAWLLPMRLADDALDAWLAAAVDESTLMARHPLPVLGIPGWWAANEDAMFYDDPQVFRPLREGGAAAIIRR